MTIGGFLLLIAFIATACGIAYRYGKQIEKRNNDGNSDGN